MHADALVEAGRARRVCGVDAERGTRHPAPPKLAEAVVEQGATEAPSPPRAPHAEGSHPPDRRPGLVADDACDLVAVPDHEPQGGIEVRPALLPRPPLLERLRRMLPVVGEGLLERG